MATFYLGTHQANWLSDPRFTRVPLFITRERFYNRRKGELRAKLPRARGRWALDSGAFTEIARHGTWTVSPFRYADDVRRLRDEVGRLDFASPQDWMCEEAMTYLTQASVRQHQERTFRNFLLLREAAPDLPIIPVLQGWTIGHYDDHAKMYSSAGVDLEREPTVGIGSVCKRQRELAGVRVLYLVSSATGLTNLHAFGFKSTSLRMLCANEVQYGEPLPVRSADSMSWSFQARRQGIRLPGCTHDSCRNCPEWALKWRAQLLGALREMGCESFG